MAIPEIHYDRREAIQGVARKTRRSLTLWIVFLLAVVLVLAFRVGAALWPTWLAANRSETAGVVLLALLMTVCLSPVMVEANSNPRHFHGIGKSRDERDRPILRRFGRHAE